MRRWFFLFSLIGMVITTIILSLPDGSSATKPVIEAQSNHSPKKKTILRTPTGVWEQIAEDHFDQDQLDDHLWTPMNREASYNKELQFYTPSNVQIVDGKLHLTAKKERKGKKKYTSGLVDTKQKLSFLYGRVEIRMKVPIKKGMLPALWLLPANKRVSLPEIDIVEIPGIAPRRIYMVNHWQNKGELQTVFNTHDLPNVNRFHTYTLEWDKREIRWYIDGKLRSKTRKGVPQRRMYLIMNLAVGGEWPGNPTQSLKFPITMEIDSVKIYQKKGELAQ